MIPALFACAKTDTEAEVHNMENRDLHNRAAEEQVEDAASVRIQMEGGVNASAIEDEAEEVDEQAVHGAEAP